MGRCVRGRSRDRVTRAIAIAGVLALGCASGDTTGGMGVSFGPVGDPGGQDDLGTDGPPDDDGGDGGDDGATGMVDGDDTAGADDDGADDLDCEDADGDGFGVNCAAGDDCDDADPDINPGAPETCDGTDENCDNMVDNGCECPDDGVSGNCNAPQDLGMLAVGDSVLSVVGNVPQEGAIDWYSIAFPAPARPGEGMPHVTFAINEGDAFVFDVVGAQCDANGVACTSGGTNGTGIALTDWTFVDDDPGCCTPPMDSMVPWPNQIFVRVYRTTMGPSCSTYQLTVSR